MWTCKPAPKDQTPTPTTAPCVDPQPPPQTSMFVGGMGGSSPDTFQSITPKKNSRVPTFFSYVHGNIQQNDKISEEPQGPHTIAHKFVEDYANTHMWTDIFDEQVQPFNPQVVLEILSSEDMPPFENQARYIEDYTRFYLQLSVWRHDGTLEKIDLEDIANDTPLYDIVHHYMMCILEMHPYGSYGWNRGHAKNIAPQEIGGKGESIISMDDYEDHLDTIVDVHGHFKNQAAFLSFLGIRIPPRASASPDSEDEPVPPLDFAPILGSRTRVVAAEAQVLVDNIEHWLQALSPNGKSLVLSLAPFLPIEEADNLFHEIQTASSESYSLVKGAVSNLRLFRAFHDDAFPMAEWETLQDFMENTLATFNVNPYPLPPPEGQLPSDGPRIPHRIAELLLKYAPLFKKSAAVNDQDAPPPNPTASTVPAEAELPDDSPTTVEEPLSIHTLLRAMRLARNLVTDQSETDPINLPDMDAQHLSGEEMYAPNDPNCVLQARDAVGLDNAVVVAGPGGIIYFSLEGQQSVIHLICLNGSCAVGHASILTTPWLGSFVSREDATQVPAPPADQNEAAPSSPEPPLPENFTANNCLIIAIYQAKLRSENIASAEEAQAMRPTTQEMIEIRRRINAPLRSFLDADEATIQAIREVLDITNNISCWQNGTLLAFFNSDGNLPNLSIHFSNSHFTAIDPALNPATVFYTQRDQPAQPPTPDTAQNSMGESLVRAIALGGQRYAGTGIITPTSRKIRDIRRMRGCPGHTPLPCDARTISYIRSVLGIDNPICIMKGSEIKYYYPGVAKRSVIFLWDLDGFYMHANPVLIEPDIFNAVSLLNPDDWTSPDHLVESILELLEINAAEDVCKIVALVRGFCSKRISDFLELNMRVVHAICKAVDRKLNFVVIREKTRSSEFVWAKGEDVLILSDVGDRYEPLKRLPYRKVFGESPPTDVNPSCKQNVLENEEEAASGETEPVGDPLLTAIAQAFKKVPGIRVPNALAKEVYGLCNAPFQLDLLPTVETLEIIQQVLEIPNPIHLVFESKTELTCDGQEGVEPIVLHESKDAWTVAQENPIHQVPPPDAIRFAVNFLTLPVDLDPQFFPNLLAILSELKANQMRLRFLILYPGATRNQWEEDLLMCTQLVVSEAPGCSEDEMLQRLQDWLLFGESFSNLLQCVEYTSSFNWLRDFTEHDLPILSQQANIDISLQSFHFALGDNYAGLVTCDGESNWTQETPSHHLQIMRIFGANSLTHYCCPGGKTEIANSLPSTISVLLGAELDRFNIEHPPASQEEDAEVQLPPPVVEFAAFARQWDNFMRFAIPSDIAPINVYADILSTQDSLTAGVHLHFNQTPPGPRCTVQLGNLGAVRVELMEVPFCEPIEGDTSPLRHLHPASRREVLSGNAGVLCAAADQPNGYFMRINRGTAN